MQMLKRSVTTLSLGLVVLAFAASAAVAQMPRPDTTSLLSASDVSQEEIQKTARIAAAVQGPMRKVRMKLRRDMKNKYGNPQQMDSTQKANAKREIRRRQMKMRKKQMKLIQQESQKEGMKPQRFRKILQSARQDTTLQQKLQKAMKAEMKKQQSMGQQNPNNQ